eukprot:CAMPEP_0180083706 /NCGR_PEP_ID=MMETSP0985-20121206/19474_1 /TAXON_ID=483367 /ORGANISM="non described non described, Strain CCMP 2436" /LENGTH=290 /DNA_ID=CAMNT_0022017325 /DNA_START=813 /DNA_END=1681 /DNA_ORIENTATION=-
MTVSLSVSLPEVSRKPAPPKTAIALPSGSLATAGPLSACGAFSSAVHDRAPLSNSQKSPSSLFPCQPPYTTMLAPRSPMPESRLPPGAPAAPAAESSVHEVLVDSAHTSSSRAAPAKICPPKTSIRFEPGCQTAPCPARGSGVPREALAAELSRCVHVTAIGSAGPAAAELVDILQHALGPARASEDEELRAGTHGGMEGARTRCGLGGGGEHHACPRRARQVPAPHVIVQLAARASAAEHDEPAVAVSGAVPASREGGGGRARCAPQLPPWRVGKRHLGGRLYDEAGEE